MEGYSTHSEYTVNEMAMTKTTGTGQQNTSFFTGKAEKHSSKIPYRPLIEIDQTTAVAKTYKYFFAKGIFAGHISKMIPGFAEKQIKVAEAIVNGEFKRFLDIGTSEGIMIKTIAENNKHIRAVGIEPNGQMKINYESTREVKNAEFRQEAFLASWRDDDGIDIKEFKPAEEFDVINEDCTFQFMNNNRYEQVKAVKKMMTKDGIFITSEKFHTKNHEANESKKLEYQRRYFNETQLTEDRETIVCGMDKDMVSDVEYEKILKDYFEHFEEFWNAGNFKGYLASDNLAVLRIFKKNVGDLTSDFSESSYA